jgi:hypothetical protein
VATPEGFAAVGALYDMVADAGFGQDRALDAFVFVASFILGYMRVDESRLSGQPDQPGEPYDHWAGVEHEQVIQLGHRLVESDWDDQYERCIDLIIEGLRLLSAGDHDLG